MAMESQVTMGEMAGGREGGAASEAMAETVERVVAISVTQKAERGGAEGRQRI